MIPMCRAQLEFNKIDHTGWTLVDVPKLAKGARLSAGFVPGKVKEQRTEMDKWLMTNGSQCGKYYQSSRFIWFENEEDAILFAMKWL